MDPQTCLFRLLNGSARPSWGQHGHLGQGIMAMDQLPVTARRKVVSFFSLPSSLQGEARRERREKRKERKREGRREGRREGGRG